MRRSWLWLCFVALLASACSDSKSKPKDKDQDASEPSGDDDGGAQTHADAGTTSLLRPALERPPTKGLPADLRPPR